MNFKQAKGISVKDFLRRQQHEIYGEDAYGDFNNQLGNQQFKPTPGMFYIFKAIRKYNAMFQISYIAKSKRAKVMFTYQFYTLL